jgi:hypothetical protein
MEVMKMNKKLLAAFVMFSPILGALALDFTNLAALGEELGGFFTGIGPGVIYIILAMTIVGGIGLLLRGVFERIKGKI